MKHLVSFKRVGSELWRSEDGQGVTEYILILSFSVATSVLFARLIKAAVDRGVLLLGGELEKDLKTGRTQLGAWKN